MEENTPIQDATSEVVQEQPKKRQFKKRTKIFLVVIIWLAVLSPLLGLLTMLSVASGGDMPTFEELENPKSNLASVVISGDAVELGKYFRENRTSAKYHELSPFLVQALIATEDERFRDHSGIDVRATGRVIKGVVQGSSSTGGGSTITQQLAKMLFPRKKLTKWELIQRKFKEWIIASRLEKGYSKNEIVAMYLNKFDFLNNAVGINSAAQVYFNAKPDSLELHEAAMLIGMAKNPSLFNPLRRPDTVMHRRMVVMGQMVKAGYIDSAQYNASKNLPLGLKYSRVDHQDGIAPYFRETLREVLKDKFREKNEDGTYVYAKEDGTKYDIYTDGLKIYTSLDSRMQKHAEWAVRQHLKAELQAQFDENNLKWKNPPFSNDLKTAQIDTILSRAKRGSQMYKMLTGKICKSCERPKDYLTKIESNGHSVYDCSHCKHQEPVRNRTQIDKIFNTPHNTRVFDWKADEYEKDTLMSPLDSIKYYKGFLRAGMMSMDPHTGYVKAWVGGPHYRHFKYDMVMKGKRQVGSTFKPFVYATALFNDKITPCTEYPNVLTCIDIPYNKYRSKQWCPDNSGGKLDGTPTPINYALAASMNNITARVMKELGTDGPNKVLKLVSKMGIDTSSLPPVPSMALGVFDLPIYQMVGAISTFANNGVFVKPTFITRIEDKNGNVIFEAIPEMTEALDEEDAYVILSMLKGVTAGVSHPYKKGTAGTAIRIRGSKKHRPYAGIKYPIAGKTGTTQNQSDGWFMGLTPDLVTGVWVGAEDRAVRFRSLRLGMGTNMALPIWGYYMNKVYEDSTLNISTKDFDKPGANVQKILDCKNYRNNKDGDFNEWGDDQIDDVDDNYFEEF